MRKILLSIAIVLAVAGCATTTSPSTTQQQVLADVSAALTTLSANLATIQATSPMLISPAQLATIKGYIAEGQAAVATIQASPTTAATTNLQLIENDLNAVLNAVQPFAALAPAPFGTIVAAAALIAPEVEALINPLLAPVMGAAAPGSAPVRDLAWARAQLGAAVVK